MSTTKEPVTVGGDGIVREVRDLVEHYTEAKVLTVEDPVDGTKALVVQSGTSIMPLPSTTFDGYRDAPRFRHGTAVLLSIDSLIDHVQRFKDSESVVFADDDRHAPSITAVLDYHPGGGAAEIGHGLLPRFGKHRSTFAFPLSDEWKAWTENNGPKNAMTMVEFAAFLEERLPDILALVPGEDTLSEDIQKMVDALGGSDIIGGPTRLMEVSRGLQINENSVVRQVHNNSSGEGVIQWESTHTDNTGAPLKLPKVFLIGIPVFRNDGLYRLAARLRYRVNGGKITFWYELWRIDRTFDHAFKMGVERVGAETELPVLMGKPEA